MRRRAGACRIPWSEYRCPGRTCTKRDPECTGPAGTELTNFESLDRTYDFSTGLVADFHAGGTLGQVYTQLDPDHMQRKLVDGKCVPVYPHQYVRDNTIF